MAEELPDPVLPQPIKNSIRKHINTKQRKCILDCLRLGAHITVACKKARITMEQLEQYIANSVYFKQDMDEAEADFEIRCLYKMQTGYKNWPALARILESAHPERWDKRATRYGSANSSGKIEIEWKDD